MWNATITFVALIVISLVFDRIGFFEWTALHLLARANRDAKRALLYLLLLGAVVAVLAVTLLALADWILLVR